MARELSCQGCGDRFLWVVKRGPVPKWCSERCRKAQYDKQCSDCGVRVSGSSPGRSSGRCTKCARAQRAEALLAEGWPSAVTVIKAFGSWNAAIRAAGFEPSARVREMPARVT